MSSYTISKKLNPNKVFILQKSELEKRFDPQFYINRVKIKNSIKLSKLVKVRGGKRIPKGKYYSEKPTDYQYLRVGDMLNFGLINWNGLKFIPEDVYYFLERYKVEKGDVIISIAGTVGKTALIEKEIKNTILTENCAILEIRDKSILLPKYLHILLELSTSKRQIELGFIQTTIPKLGFDKIQQLELPPNPTIDRQSEIIEFYENTISTKQENEEKSKNLLNSIDTYLLKELGITLPEKEENTLKSRMFTTSISELSGTRFDPYFNKAYFKNVQSAFENCSVDFSNIKSTLQYIKTGTTPHQKLNPFTENKEIVFLRNTNLKKYRIDLENTKYVKTEFNKELTYSLKGEVIMCIAGTVGLSAINDINEPISINQNVSALKFYENVINPNFASYWFNTSIFIELTKRACSVATIHYLNNDNLKLLPIPIPPLEKQLEIAEHISAIRKQAQDLKDQTKLLLEKANKEIEDILLNT